MNVSFSTQIYSHSRDMRFLTDMNVKIDEVMTKENLITAPVGTTHETAREILCRHKKELCRNNLSPKD